MGKASLDTVNSLKYSLAKFQQPVLKKASTLEVQFGNWEKSFLSENNFCVPTGSDVEDKGISLPFSGKSVLGNNYGEIAIYHSSNNAFIKCDLANVCLTTVMRSLYLSLLNSHLSYGLAAWGNANKVDQTYYQLSTLMWEYDYVLPSSLTKCFTRSNHIHTYKTCGASHGNLYHTKVNTSKYDIKAFKYQGVQVLNNLKKLDIYRNAKTKLHFV